MARTSPARLLALVALAVAASSCDSATGNGGTFTMALSDPTLTLDQGKVDTVLISITRSGFSKSIALTVDGLPTGVTATLDPATVAGNNSGSFLVLTSAGTASPGTGTITVHATAEGVTEQTSTIGITVGVTGSFTMGTLGAVTAAQGGTAMATVLVPRVGGHADSVSLTVSGAPSGVVATPSPTSTTSGASLAITADGTVPVGAYTLKVKGTAQGNLADSVNVTLNVIAPPSTATLVVPFCSNFMPTWFAYQNEGYGWQQIAPTNNVFTFQATAKVGVAYVFLRQNPSETDLSVYYASREEHAAATDRDCDGPKVVNGSVSGATTGQSVRVGMGAAVATATAASPNFAIANVADRVLDLTATKGTVAASQFNLQVVPDRVLFRRGLNPTSGTTLSTLDFAGAESFAPASSNLTMVNTAAGDALNIATSIVTATNTYGIIHNIQPTATTNTVYSVPAAQMQAGDMHELIVESYQSGFTFGRAQVTYLGALADRTETLPAIPSVPTLSAITSTPYLRLRGQFASQSDYPSFARVIAFQENTVPIRLIELVVTAAYLGGVPPTWDVVQPDFGSVTGFNSSWPLTSASVLYQAEGWGGNVLVALGAVPVIGDAIKVGYRLQDNGVIGLAVRSSTAHPFRVSPPNFNRRF